MGGGDFDRIISQYPVETLKPHLSQITADQLLQILSWDTLDADEAQIAHLLLDWLEIHRSCIINAEENIDTIECFTSASTCQCGSNHIGSPLLARLCWRIRWGIIHINDLAMHRALSLQILPRIVIELLTEFHNNHTEWIRAAISCNFSDLIGALDRAIIDAIQMDHQSQSNDNLIIITNQPDCNRNSAFTFRTRREKLLPYTKSIDLCGISTMEECLRKPLDSIDTNGPNHVQESSSLNLYVPHEHEMKSECDKTNKEPSRSNVIDSKGTSESDDDEESKRSSLVTKLAKQAYFDAVECIRESLLEGDSDLTQWVSTSDRWVSIVCRPRIATTTLERSNRELSILAKELVVIDPYVFSPPYSPFFLAD